jgi:hypothetical protein
LTSARDDAVGRAGRFLLDLGTAASCWRELVN